MKKILGLILGVVSLFMLVGCSQSLNGHYKFEGQGFHSAEMTIKEDEVEMTINTLLGKTDFEGKINSKTKTIEGVMNFYGLQEEQKMTYEVQKEGIFVADEKDPEEGMLFVKVEEEK